MARLDVKFHSYTGERRDGDFVWRMPRRRGGDGYVMLLLENQFTRLPCTALRMLVNCCILCQQFAKAREMLPDGTLPPISVILLFNGDPRSLPPLKLESLIGLPAASPLLLWQRKMRYHQIEDGVLSADDPEMRRRMPAWLFRLSYPSDSDELGGLADAVLASFACHPGSEAVPAVFGDLLSAVMAPLAPDIRMPDELWGVCNILAKRAYEWTQR